MRRPDDPPEGDPTPRRAARVILRDPANRALLIRYDVSGYIFWTTPGGAVEPGETDLQAATRELYEELHITADLQGPVHKTISRFHHEGAYVENTDIFFSAVIHAHESGFYAVTEFEAAAMREVRWWSLHELDALTDRIFPNDLASVLRRLQTVDLDTDTFVS
jgi:8-oxo-dGTP diphosphatase